jgi:hypothetical protein
MQRHHYICHKMQNLFEYNTDITEEIEINYIMVDTNERERNGNKFEYTSQADN